MYLSNQVLSTSGASTVKIRAWSRYCRLIGGWVPVDSLRWSIDLVNEMEHEKRCLPFITSVLLSFVRLRNIGSSNYLPDHIQLTLLEYSAPSMPGNMPTADERLKEYYFIKSRIGNVDVSMREQFLRDAWIAEEEKRLMYE